MTQELGRDVKEAIRKALSPRHVPAYVFQVEDIPVSTQCCCSCIPGADNFLLLQYTVNGKKIEIAVKQIVSGSKLKPSGTVANPESLKEYYRFYDIENLDESGQPVRKREMKAKL